MNKILQRIRIKNVLIREMLAEFLGTFVLLMLGCASVAQMVLSNRTDGTFLSVNIAWAGATALGVYTSGGISGGHINPAVTLAFALVGKLEWKKVPLYMIAQYLGAFMGAACAFWAYFDGLATLGKTVPGTAGVFATYPKDYLSLGNGFSDQIISTFMLMFLVMAITDPRNMEASKGIIPIAIGILIAVIGMSMGFNCGYAINPARDLSPRLFTFVAGWGTEVFTYGNYYFWIPIVGPHLGAIMGAWTYQLLIGLHWEPEDELEAVDDKKLKVETRF